MYHILMPDLLDGSGMLRVEIIVVQTNQSFETRYRETVENWSKAYLDTVEEVGPVDFILISLPVSQVYNVRPRKFLQLVCIRS